MRVVRLFASVKLTAVLIVLLALLAAIGGMLPQGGAPAAYYRTLPAPLAAAVLALGLDRLFSSALFLSAAGLFLLNLGLCSLRRLRGQLRKERGTRAFGPDILHLGLLVLAVGGILTAAGREEHSVFLTEGETARVGEEYRVTLTGFEDQRYASGAPKDWISTVRVARGGEVLRRAAEIEVNSPLRLGSHTLYQVRHARRPMALFSDGESRELRLIAGNWKELDGARVRFAAVPEGSGGSPEAGIFVLREGTERRVLRLSPGEALGAAGLRLRSLQLAEISGLKVVRDPGYRPVLAGFVLVVIGLAVTYLGKLRRPRRES